MKRVLLAVAALITSAMVLGGCASTPTLTFAQQVQITCSAVQTEVTALQTSGLFTGGAATTLANQIQPDVNAVCAAGATVTTANLQNLVNATVPAILAVIANSSLDQQAKQQAAAAITLLSITIDTAIAMSQAAATNTPVTLKTHAS